MGRALALLSAVLVCVSCGGPAPDGRPPAVEKLVPGAVAACAGAMVQPAEVARVARATSSTPARAAAMICDDARLARAARDGGLDRGPAVVMDIRAALGRALLHDLRDSDRTSFTQEEVDRVRRDHRADFDSPESIRVIHAVARFAATDPEDKRDRAAAVARAIAAATAGSHGAAEFRARASAVPHEDVDVVVEELPTMDFAGRALDGSMQVESAFAAGAARLSVVDDEVAAVSSSYGTHVIHLLERRPAHHATDDEVRATAAEELRANRARDALTKLLADVRARDHVEVERSAEDTLRGLDPRHP